MNKKHIRKILEEAFGQHVNVESNDDIHFNATIVSKAFQGLSRIDRQRKVYDVLGEAITSGQLHAISFKTYTIEEWFR